MYYTSKCNTFGHLICSKFIKIHLNLYLQMLPPRCKVPAQPMTQRYLRSAFCSLLFQSCFPLKDSTFNVSLMFRGKEKKDLSWKAVTSLLDVKLMSELNVSRFLLFLLNIDLYYFPCRRLEQNSIRAVPPGAFSPYKKLRRMWVNGVAQDMSFCKLCRPRLCGKNWAWIWKRLTA